MYEKHSDPREFVHQIIGRTCALDLLLRGLYAKWALESPTPRRSLEEKVVCLIESVKTCPPKNEDEAAIYAHAEQALRDFYYNVETRLDNIEAG